MSNTLAKFPHLFDDGVFNHRAGNSAINHIAGNNPVKGSDTIEVFKPIFDKQLGLIAEEFKELVKGLAESNIKEIRDGLSDVIVTSDGMFHRLGCAYVQELPSTTTPFPEFDDSHLIHVRDSLNAMANPNYLLRNGDVNETTQWHTVSIENIQPFLEIIGIMRRYSLLFGITPEVDQLTVFESNLSKFDTTIEKAEATKAKYEAMGVEVAIYASEYAGVEYFVVKSIVDQTVNDVFYPQGKFLKSVDYIPPQWTQLPEDALLNKMFAAAV